MKVLHVIPSISPALGGPTQVALNLVWALRESGVDAEIVTTNFDGAKPMDVPLNQQVDYPIKPAGAATVPVWFLAYDPPALKEFISANLTQWLWQNIQNYDVLDNHFLFSYVPSYAARVARWKGIPYTVRTMGQLAPWALAQSRVKKQIYTFLLERYNLKCAAAIHCTTAEEEQDVRNFGIQTPTVTLPLGVEPSPSHANAKTRLHQQYNIPADVPIVLFLSRLHYKKRPELLLEALSQLQAEQPFHAIIAGSGTDDYVAELQALAVSLGLGDRVLFPGFIVGQEKELLLQGSDLFVLPSFSENFGIAVAEALAAGLPVVITPGIQIAPDVQVAQAGLVVEGEVSPVANAIARLLGSAKLRAEMGRNGKRLATEQYNWVKIAQNLIPIYQTIVRNKRLPSNIPDKVTQKV